MRGEFRFRNGLVLPNSITTVGERAYLRAIFRNEPLSFFVGLTDAVPSKGAVLTGIDEPTIGTNGYARQAISRDASGWATEGQSGGVEWIETKDLVFAAAGGPFTMPIWRMFLTPEASALVGDVWAFSAALPEALLIDPATPVEERTFRYRVFLR